MSTPDRDRRSHGLRLSCAVLLALTGGVLSVLLWSSHLQVFEGGVAGGFVCAGSGLFDCDAVAAHSSSWIGGFPLPLLGLLFYAFMLLLLGAATCLPGEERRALVAFGRIAATLAVLFDVYLALVLWFDVGALCSLCLATYAVNVGLMLVLGAWDRALPGAPRWSRLLVSGRGLRGTDAAHHREAFKLGYWVLAAGVLLTLHVQAVLPFAEARARGTERLNGLLIRLFTAQPTIDMARFEGQPALGSASARVQLAVVGDFECAYCRSTARSLTRWQAAFPEQVRLMFINSPLSSRCNPAVPGDLHPRACWLAELTEAAHEQGRFWPVHDYLFSLPERELDEPSVRAGLAHLDLDAVRLGSALASGGPAEQVRRDVALCAELGLTATPSVVLAGHVLKGGMPAWMVDELMSALIEVPKDAALP